ncbi:hypothetical protein Tco_0654027 [Tanacetum coccineum]|uniref:Uncharacterized protein n=1 Tax=Tanacetum coccineum TaxID=301880 RepID=A0ABQ4X2H7_9ASTR
MAIAYGQFLKGSIVNLYCGMGNFLGSTEVAKEPYLCISLISSEITKYVRASHYISKLCPFIFISYSGMLDHDANDWGYSFKIMNIGLIEFVPIGKCNRVSERQTKLRNQIFRALTASADVPSSVTETTDTTSTLQPPRPPLQTYSSSRYLEHLKMEMEIPCSNKIKFITACSFSNDSFEDIMKAQVSVIKASATLNIQAFKIKKSVSISFRMTQVHKMAKDHMMMIRDYDWMMISKKLKDHIQVKLKPKSLKFTTSDSQDTNQ